MAEAWDRVKELFSAALEKGPSERADFLARECGNNDSLRAEVESLLASYGQADSCLENSPADNLFSTVPSLMAGKRIGPYRIIRESGHGGMAVVYLAERADRQYEKRVAIKMVQPGINSDEILRRFRNERQTLAALDHPNIVKLLDGGTTEEGLPYLVMDYVEGIPIDEYCDSRALSIKQRLVLFRIVCVAVRYAHENQVIHRDLKPSNILVTAEGIPRLLDFGIAKLLNPERFAQTTLVTRAGLHAMTPEYASPEQIRGEMITSASDIYSLGVLLYWLLTGHSPYHPKNASVLELQKLICDEEPTKPSTVVAQSKQKRLANGESSVSISPQTVSSARSCQVGELRRRLQGDLDAIVLNALRKEPGRRYHSVEDLSNDIQRHLSGVPVRARKGTALYRSAKFFQRHREAVTAVAILLILVGGITAWYAHGTWKQSRAETLPHVSGAAAVQPRPAVAVLGFKNLSSHPETGWISTAISEMLSTELAAGEKLRTVPTEAIARTRIDLGLPDVDTLASNTLGRLRKNLGSDFVVLGSYLDLGEEGRGQLRLDIRLQNTTKGETVASLSETGDERHLLELVSRVGARLRERLGVASPSQGELLEIIASAASNQEAERYYSQGLEKLRSFDAQGARALFRRSIKADPSYPLAHLALAKAWQTLGYDANALQEAKKALDLSGNLSRENHSLIEASYDETSHDWAKAIENYRILFGFFPDNIDYGLYLAGAQISAGKGPDALKTLSVLTDLSAQARDDPRINQAIARAGLSIGDNKLARDAAENAATKAGEQGGRFLLARARSVECRALANLGENEKANAACEEARRVYAEAGDRGGLARALHEMAEVPIDQGDFAAAEKLYKEALVNVRQIGDQRGIARELSNLGVVYKRQGDFASARRMYEAALQSERLSGDKWNIASTMGNTGNLLFAEGKLSEALQYYRRTLVLSEELGQKSSIALSHSAIAQTLMEQGDLSGAYKRFQQVLSIEKEIGEKTYYASTETYVGEVLSWRGQLEEARAVFAEAISSQDQLKDRVDAAETRLALAELNCDSSRAPEAESLARAALQAFSAQKLTDLEISAEAVLARSLLQQGKISESEASLERALKLETNSHHAIVRLSLQIDRARILAGTGDLAASEKTARNVFEQTRKSGLFRLQLEAALALGEVELKEKDPAAGRERLRQLAKTARARGFGSIAKRALAAIS